MALLAILAEASEPSKTPFYIVGGVLAAYAVVLAAVGILKPDFPGGETGARGVMAFSVVLVAAAMAAAVIST